MPADKYTFTSWIPRCDLRCKWQLPTIYGHRSLIDIDTPKEAYTKPSWNGGADMELVFSDEFNVPGRTFWPGDDPYWEAVNLHYWVWTFQLHYARRLADSSNYRQLIT